MNMIDKVTEGASKKDLAKILSGYLGQSRNPNSRESAIKAIIIACGDEADPAYVIGRGLTLLRQGEEPTKESMLTTTEGDQAEQREARRRLSQDSAGMDRVALLEELLTRPEGATVAEITEATGWLPHTARGRISDKFRGRVRAERVREVGPNKIGAKGSFTRYYLDA